MPDTEALRDVTAAARILAANGVPDLPPAIDDPRRAFLDLTRARPDGPDMHAIGTLALDESPAKAATVLSSARVAIDVHAAALDVAGRRATIALSENADAVIDAVLTSPAVRSAVEEIVQASASVSPSVRRNPPQDAPEDEIIGAARLRRAEAVIARAVTGLMSIFSLGFHLEEEHLGLVYLDPAGVAAVDVPAMSRALRGVRHGVTPIPVKVTRPGLPGFPVDDDSWHGLTSASAAAVPGLRVSLVGSGEELTQRISRFRRLEAGPGSGEHDGGPLVAGFILD